MSKTGLHAPTAANRGSGFFIPGKFWWPLRRWRESGGGASRDRTDDLKLAKLALSQLSYGPHRPTQRLGKSQAKKQWWAE
jgi:hypothetical protein